MADLMAITWISRNSIFDGLWWANVLLSLGFCFWNASLYVNHIVSICLSYAPMLYARPSWPHSLYMPHSLMPQIVIIFLKKVFGTRAQTRENGLVSKKNNTGAQTRKKVFFVRKSFRKNVLTQANMAVLQKLFQQNVVNTQQWSCSKQVSKHTCSVTKQCFLFFKQVFKTTLSCTHTCFRFKLVQQNVLTHTHEQMCFFKNLLNETCSVTEKWLFFKDFFKNTCSHTDKCCFQNKVLSHLHLCPKSCFYFYFPRHNGHLFSFLHMFFYMFGEFT